MAGLSYNVPRVLRSLSKIDPYHMMLGSKGPRDALASLPKTFIDPQNTKDVVILYSKMTRAADSQVRRMIIQRWNMRLRNVPGSREVIAENEYVVHDEKSFRGRWNEVFGNDRPLHVEIGMGKGSFLLEMARLHPEINFLGIEKYSSVLLRAIEKHEEAPELTNLKFIRMDAEEIEEVFAPGEIAYIYLNFSDPWPKARHAKHRLTSDRFLRRYEKLLAADGGVTFKTDNVDLFDFSVESAEECGWELAAISRDLHKSPYAEGNVMTEYERKFAGLGNKICMMQIRPHRT